MNTAVAAALVQRAFKSAPAKGGQAYAETDVYLVGSVGEDGYGFQLREELERHQVKLDLIDLAPQPVMTGHYVVVNLDKKVAKAEIFLKVCVCVSVQGPS